MSTLSAGPDTTRAGVTPDQLLDPLLASMEAGEAVAVVTVVEATGRYRPAVGNSALVRLDKPSLGDLALDDMSEPVLNEARACLSARKPQLLRFQQAFQASAQVIATADELFDSLLAAVSR